VKAITTNRRARHDYQITETFEAGLVLQGSEVKSLRNGTANLKDAYVMVREGEAWLIGAYIAPYAFSRRGAPARTGAQTAASQAGDREDRLQGS